MLLNILALLCGQEQLRRMRALGRSIGTPHSATRGLGPRLLPGGQVCPAQVWGLGEASPDATRHLSGAWSPLQGLEDRHPPHSHLFWGSTKKK